MSLVIRLENEMEPLMESSSSLSSWFPSGKHFNPRDDELLVHLLNFVTGEPFSCKDSVSVPVVDLYGDREPWELFSQYSSSSSSSQTKKKRDLYFYTKLKKKNKNGGKRVSRLIGKGSWHGQDRGKKILYKGQALLGYKKSMVYQNVKNPSQHKQWLLKEYSLSDSVVEKSNLILPELKDFVLCRMRQKKNKKEEEESVAGSDEQSDGDPSDLLSKFREKISANLEEIKQQANTTGLLLQANEFLGFEFDGDEDDFSNFFC